VSGFQEREENCQGEYGDRRDACFGDGLRIDEGEGLVEKN
jgi:hypothetical protein